MIKPQCFGVIDRQRMWLQSLIRCRQAPARLFILETHVLRCFGSMFEYLAITQLRVHCFGAVCLEQCVTFLDTAELGMTLCCVCLLDVSASGFVLLLVV